MSLISNNSIVMVKFVIFGFFLCASSAKEYKRCEVTNILKDNGFDRSLLPACRFSWIYILKWILNKFLLFTLGVCLVNAESGRQTDKVTTHGHHKNYGLFQIQSMEYCTPGKKNGGGMCKSDCNGKFLLQRTNSCLSTRFNRFHQRPPLGWHDMCKEDPGSTRLQGVA